ncbi:MAG TPA: TonB-dependent receptor [Steroidobacteraceae bacterium]|jgi:iron complex outermembrane receptor protein|nr:TonB-dependent receptor [Steroidobacteraceae bacterium]
MQLSKKLSSLGLIGAAVAAALGSLPAQAQTAAPADSEQLDEVLVTARRRSESFKDVPITVNVFTKEAIQSAGIEKPADFIARVPNMTLVETQNAGNAFVVLRGISQARNSEPSVAVLVDGVLETNPAEFNQELFDIEQIEVLKGPQGAVYGRNAIGGAIIIRTQDPGDEFSGRVKLGVGNGNAYRVQAGVSGPAGDVMKYRASVNYYDTDGYLPSTFLGGKADPVKDLSARLRLSFEPNDSFNGDVRFSYDKLETRGFYFVIPRDNEANPFSTFSTPPNANDVTSPIQVDQAGIDNRDLFTGALRLNFNVGGGTLTSVSAYNDTREIITGDAYDFRPAANSIFKALLGFDLNQSQFLDLTSYSEEIRFTSSEDHPLRWILGAYYVHTDRFISTGNMVDDGTGVHPVYREPRLTGNNPSATYLADTQNNDAWAVFGDVTWTINDQWEADLALRYDEDRRENTTDTPPAFLPDPSASTGEVRTKTFSEPQPKFTLRYKPNDSTTLYGGWSRGFRSGGFNQTGVGAVADASGIAGVNDIFQAEVADTWELGFKGQYLDRRLNVGLSVFDTKSTNGYFFVFLAANSTQNLGNLDAKYQGAEFEISGRVTDNLELFASGGYTDSKITGMEDPAVIGNEAPLVSRYTANVGAQWKQPVGGNLNLAVRVDYQRIGETWWEPYNVTSRDPIDLVDLRIGLEGEKWAVTAWSKNLNDEKYNAEFSPGGFLFRALPQRYGLEFSYNF